MHAIERSDLAADPDLASNDGRWRRRDELDAAIGAFTARHPRDVVLKILDEAGVPSGPIFTAADKQYAARNMIQHLPVDIGETEPKQVGFPGIVPVIGGASLPIRSVGPDLGEHTDEIRLRYLDWSTS
nr:hypothetical protein GCM10017611_07060 [Rhodococcus wratislaviensis]